MGDIGAISGAVASVSSLIEGILDRADRDAPDKELNENIIKIQNSFADNSLDDQWALAYRLFTYAGNPLTPGGSVGDTDRQFRHNALISLANLIYERRLAARAIAKLTSK